MSDILSEETVREWVNDQVQEMLGIYFEDGVIGRDTGAIERLKNGLCKLKECRDRLLNLEL